MCGRKQMMEVWPACLTAGLSFGGTQYLISNYIGASLAAIGASVVSMIALVVSAEVLAAGYHLVVRAEDGSAAGVRARQPENLYNGTEIQGMDALDSALGVRIHLGPDAGEDVPERRRHGERAEFS